MTHTHLGEILCPKLWLKSSCPSFLFLPVCLLVPCAPLDSTRQQLPVWQLQQLRLLHAFLCLVSSFVWGVRVLCVSRENNSEFTRKNIRKNVMISVLIFSKYLSQTQGSCFCLPWESMYQNACGRTQTCAHAQHRTADLRTPNTRHRVWYSPIRVNGQSGGSTHWIPLLRLGHGKQRQQYK